MRDDDSLAERITELRKSRELSLQQVADLVGCTKTHIWDMERGKAANPTLSTLLGLSRALGCSLSFLAGVHDVLPDYHPDAIDVAAKLDQVLRNRRAAA